MTDNKKDIRWRQRFANLERALKQLNESLAIEEPSDTEKAGAIQFFELSFELSWKVMKDYLESLGYIENGPRPVIKKAFELGIISDGEGWLEGLLDRNSTTHIYNEERINHIFEKIKNRYLNLMEDLEKYLKQQNDK